MFQGFGSPMFITQDLTASTAILAQNILAAPELLQFTLTADIQTKEAFKMVDGIQQVASSARGRTAYTLSVSNEHINWQNLGFYLDEVPQTSTSVTVPRVRTGTVPSSSAYEVVDTEIVSGTVASLKVYITEKGTGAGDVGYRKVAATPATPSAGEFGYATSGTKLIFHSSDAGAKFTYVINKTYASIRTIGYEASADAYGKLGFLGLLVGPEFPSDVLLYLPNITRKTIANIEGADGVPQLTTEFTANVPAGKRVPYQLFNLDGAS